MFVAQKATERITASATDSVSLVNVPNLVLVEQMVGVWSLRTPRSGHEAAGVFDGLDHVGVGRIHRF
ncbi:hypothetical protein D3C74_201870 [compost metagenome]